MEQLADVDVYPNDETRLACVFRNGAIAIVDMRNQTMRYSTHYNTQLLDSRAEVQDTILISESIFWSRNMESKYLFVQTLGSSILMYDENLTWHRNIISGLPKVIDSQLRNKVFELEDNSGDENLLGF